MLFLKKKPAFMSCHRHGQTRDRHLAFTIYVLEAKLSSVFTTHFLFDIFLQMFILKYCKFNHIDIVLSKKKKNITKVICVFKLFCYYHILRVVTIQ